MGPGMGTPSCGVGHLKLTTFLERQQKLDLLKMATILQIKYEKSSEYLVILCLLVSTCTMLCLSTCTCTFEYLDFTFLLKCLQHPPDHFNIFNFIQFVSGNTSSSSASILKCILPHSSLNCIHFFYFNCVVRISNSLPVINSVSYHKDQSFSLGVLSH